MSEQEDPEYEGRILLQFNEKLLKANRNNVIARGIATAVDQDKRIVSKAWSTRYQDSTEVPG